MELLLILLFPTIAGAFIFVLMKKRNAKFDQWADELGMRRTGGRWLAVCLEGEVNGHPIRCTFHPARKNSEQYVCFSLPPCASFFFSLKMGGSIYKLFSKITDEEGEIDIESWLKISSQSKDVVRALLTTPEVEEHLNVIRTNNFYSLEALVKETRVRILHVERDMKDPIQLRVLAEDLVNLASALKAASA